ncbi:MAG TPA: DUF1028 domain-containing protein [Gaiellaceae bacterium]|nr:DUF1028 domain-containing protein [Gaiellaceae bacterium]
MTYSIAARDADTRELGIAVQTRFFAVGQTVPWARPGVGAVATQAFADRRYGALGIELLAAGRSPQAALDELTASDAEAAVRQVGVVAADGRSAAHTGAACVPAAGHITGEGFSAQANMMRTEEVWPAMAEAFAASRRPLPWRLLDALDAAEAAGGDFRGKQSAAILVVRGEPSERPWDDKLLELRVDDHPEPLSELRRLLELADGYRALLQLREGDPPPEAVAAVRRLPELDVRWSETYAALRDGDVERARALVRPLFESEPRWRGYVASLAARGLLPHADELLRE